MCSHFLITHNASHGITFPWITQRLCKWTIPQTEYCVCAVCVCVCDWLIFNNHIRISSHPTLQCPLSLSLIAGSVRLNTHMGAREGSLLQRGEDEETEILQLRERDAPVQKTVDWTCPAAMPSWDCDFMWTLVAVFRRPVAMSRNGPHTESRIPASDCSCWPRNFDFKLFYFKFQSKILSFKLETKVRNLYSVSRS